MGYCSRTEAARLISDGRVALNGKVRHDPETPVEMEKDKITVDGAPLSTAQKLYWMLNKPGGYVTTADDEKGRKTVYTLLPEGSPWMGPVGRLDMASEGLLLLTNDTEWAARITSPESHLDKTYHVQLNCRADETLPEKFEAGVRDKGEFLKAKQARLLRAGEKNCWLEVVLDEGKNRQIRRLSEALGLEVLRLVRVAIGKLPLGALPKGQSRPLTEKELELLRQL
jgi:23S rRNA pseudouridine2605 synthase